MRVVSIISFKSWQESQEGYDDSRVASATNRRSQNHQMSLSGKHWRENRAATAQLRWRSCAGLHHKRGSHFIISTACSFKTETLSFKKWIHQINNTPPTHAHKNTCYLDLSWLRLPFLKTFYSNWKQSFASDWICWRRAVRSWTNSPGCTRGSAAERRLIISTTRRLGHKRDGAPLLILFVKLMRARCTPWWQWEHHRGNNQKCRDWSWNYSLNE